MSAPGPARKSFLTEAICLLFLAFATFLLVTNILPTKRSLRAIEDEIRRVEGQNRDLRESLARTRLKADALETDPFAVEREIRESMRITRPDEKLIRVEGD